MGSLQETQTNLSHFVSPGKIFLCSEKVNSRGLGKEISLEGMTVRLQSELCGNYN